MAWTHQPSLPRPLLGGRSGPGRVTRGYPCDPPPRTRRSGVCTSCSTWEGRSAGSRVQRPASAAAWGSQSAQPPTPSPIARRMPDQRRRRRRRRRRAVRSSRQHNCRTRGRGKCWERGTPHCDTAVAGFRVPSHHMPAATASVGVYVRKHATHTANSGSGAVVQPSSVHRICPHVPHHSATSSRGTSSNDRSGKHAQCMVARNRRAAAIRRLSPCAANDLVKGAAVRTAQPPLANRSTASVRIGGQIRPAGPKSRFRRGSLLSGVGGEEWLGRSGVALVAAARGPSTKSTPPPHLQTHAVLTGTALVQRVYRRHSWLPLSCKWRAPEAWMLWRRAGCCCCRSKSRWRSVTC